MRFTPKPPLCSAGQGKCTPALEARPPPPLLEGNCLPAGQAPTHPRGIVPLHRAPPHSTRPLRTSLSLWVGKGMDSTHGSPALAAQDGSSQTTGSGIVSTAPPPRESGAHSTLAHVSLQGRGRQSPQLPTQDPTSLCMCSLDFGPWGASSWRGTMQPASQPHAMPAGVIQGSRRPCWLPKMQCS